MANFEGFSTLIVAKQNTGKSTVSRYIFDNHNQRALAILGHEQEPIWKDVPFLGQGTNGKAKVVYDKDLEDMIVDSTDILLTIDDPVFFTESRRPHYLRQLYSTRRQFKKCLLYQCHSFAEFPPSLYQFLTSIIVGCVDIPESGFGMDRIDSEKIIELKKAVEECKNIARAQGGIKGVFKKVDLLF